MFAGAVLDISDFPTRHPYSLAIWQNQIERILGAWVAELPASSSPGGTRRGAT
jgi:3-(3-hydroxy-phenyl)propionate hydroxylase